MLRIQIFLQNSVCFSHFKDIKILVSAVIEILLKFEKKLTSQKKKTPS
jgi:hypothetical protein